MDGIKDEIKQKLESKYVKSTYDNIAEDFSKTRYKKWPKVNEFLQNLGTNSLLLDVGCGNGKYLDNPTTFNIGCDASSNLLSICKRKGFEVVQCDMVALPFRKEVFDSVICIAALHHIVTSSRRQKCVQDMLDLLTPTQSKLLIQVWSFEQNIDKNNPYLRQHNQRGDNMIEASASNQVSLDDNLSISIHKNRTPFKSQDLLVPFKSGETRQEPSDKPNLRYYHLFREKELDALVQHIPDSHINQSYHDTGNWCVVVAKKS